MYEYQEHIDKSEIYMAMIKISRKQNQEIYRQRRELASLKTQLYQWIARAGLAEGMTETQIRAMIDDVKGI